MKKNIREKTYIFIHRILLKIFYFLDEIILFIFYKYEILRNNKIKKDETLLNLFLVKYFNFLIFKNKKIKDIFSLLIKDKYFINIRILENIYFYFLMKNIHKYKTLEIIIKKIFFNINIKYDLNDINNYFLSHKISVSFHFYSLYHLIVLHILFNKRNIIILVMNENEYINKIINLLKSIDRKYKQNILQNKINLVNINENMVLKKIAYFYNCDYDILFFIDVTFQQFCHKSLYRNLISIELFGKEFYFKTNLFRFFKINNMNEIKYYIIIKNDKNRYTTENISYIRNKEIYIYNKFKSLICNKEYFNNWEIANIFLYFYTFKKKDSKAIFTYNNKLIENVKYKVNKKNFYLLKLNNKYFVFSKIIYIGYQINKNIYYMLKKGNLIISKSEILKNQRLNYLLNIFIELKFME